MKKKQTPKLILKDIDKLLNQQTVVILDAVDKKLVKTRNELREEMSQQVIIILNAVDNKLEKTTKEFKEEINTLRISIDKFVGFYTKQEQEFTIMKEHLKRLETRVVNLEAKLT